MLRNDFKAIALLPAISDFSFAANMTQHGLRPDRRLAARRERFGGPGGAGGRHGHLENRELQNLSHHGRRVVGVRFDPIFGFAVASRRSSNSWRNFSGSRASGRCVWPSRRAQILGNEQSSHIVTPRSSSSLRFSGSTNAPPPSASTMGLPHSTSRTRLRNGFLLHSCGIPLRRACRKFRRWKRLAPSRCLRRYRRTASPVRRRAAAPRPICPTP